MEIEINKKDQKIGDDKKRILYPGSVLFILEGGKLQGLDILKQPVKFVSYKPLRVNEAKEKRESNGREVIVVNGSMTIDANTVVVNNETKLENKEGQQKVFITNNEKLARELSVNGNILERERVRASMRALEAYERQLSEIIQADSQGDIL